MTSGDDGSAPLHHVGWDFSALAELLADVEARINPLDCFGYTPWFVTAGEGNLDIVHLPRMVRKIKRTTRVRHPCLLQLPQAFSTLSASWSKLVQPKKVQHP